MTKHSSKNEESNQLRKKITVRALSALTVLGLIGGIWLNVMSMKQPEFGESTMRYILEGWGNACVVMSFLLVIGLHLYYKSAYSIFFARAYESQLDERQKDVRNRLFLHSYRWFLLMLFLSYNHLMNSSPRVETITYYTLAVLAIGLPSILAPWYKNT
ncbi:MAG: hypothetical protein WBP26_03200 [Candidatus Saccharimonadales bacterium]